jgi:hypothetical protein
MVPQFNLSLSAGKHLEQRLRQYLRTIKYRTGTRRDNIEPNKGQSLMRSQKASSVDCSLIVRDRFFDFLPNKDVARSA